MAPEMTTAELEVAVAALSAKKGALRESFYRLAASAPIPIAFTWDDIDAHISSIQCSIGARMHQLRVLEAAHPGPTTADPVEHRGKEEEEDQEQEPDVVVAHHVRDNGDQASDEEEERDWAEKAPLGVNAEEDEGAIEASPLDQDADEERGIIEVSSDQEDDEEGDIIELSSDQTDDEGEAIDASPGQDDDEGEAPKTSPGHRLEERNETAKDRNVSAYRSKCLGIIDRMTDSINSLIENGRPLAAVRLACAFNLAEKYPPLSIMNEYVDKARKTAQDILSKESESWESLNQAIEKQVNTLVSSWKSVDECHFDSVHRMRIKAEIIHLLRKYANKRQSCPVEASSSNSSLCEQEELQEKYQEQQQALEEQHHQHQKAEDSINLLIENGQPLDAVRLACALNLSCKYLPLSIMNEHVEKAKRTAEDILSREVGSRESLKQAMRKQVNTLILSWKSVDECNIDIVHRTRIKAEISQLLHKYANARPRPMDFSSSNSSLRQPYKLQQQYEQQQQTPEDQPHQHEKPHEKQHQQQKPDVEHRHQQQQQMPEEQPHQHEIPHEKQQQQQQKLDVRHRHQQQQQMPEEQPHQHEKPHEKLLQQQQKLDVRHRYQQQQQMPEEQPYQHEKHHEKQQQKTDVKHSHQQQEKAQEHQLRYREGCTEQECKQRKLREKKNFYTLQSSQTL